MLVSIQLLTICLYQPTAPLPPELGFKPIPFVDTTKQSQSTRQTLKLEERVDGGKDKFKTLPFIDTSKQSQSTPPPLRLEKGTDDRVEKFRSLPPVMSKESTENRMARFNSLPFMDSTSKQLQSTPMPLKLEESVANRKEEFKTIPFVDTTKGSQVTPQPLKLMDSTGGGGDLMQRRSGLQIKHNGDRLKMPKTWLKFP